jgi:hypothetical protein
MQLVLLVRWEAITRIIWYLHRGPGLGILSRPNNVVSMFLKAPRVSHWEAITRIIRYLKRAPGLGILSKPNGHLRVKCFTDTHWTGSPSDRRSTTRYFTLLGDNLVSFNLKE